MTPIDLTKIASKYDKGWIAINKKTKKIVAFNKNFNTIIEKIKKNKNVILLPASRNFSNIVTLIYG